MATGWAGGSSRCRLAVDLPNEATLSVRAGFNVSRHKLKLIPAIRNSRVGYALKCHERQRPAKSRLRRAHLERRVNGIEHAQTMHHHKLDREKVAKKFTPHRIPLARSAVMS